MMGRHTPAIFALLMFTVAMSGAMMGAEAGYTADSPAEATASFNGTHLAVGENVTKVNTTVDAEGNEGPAAQMINGTALDYETPADPYIRDAVRGIVKGMLLSAFHVAAASAAVSAAVVYRLQFLPLWLFTGFFKIASIVPFVAVGALFLGRALDVTERFA